MRDTDVLVAFARKGIEADEAAMESDPNGYSKEDRDRFEKRKAATLQLIQALSPELKHLPRPDPSSSENATPRPWTVATTPTSIGRCHRILPFNGCVYDDDTSLNKFGSTELKANAQLIVDCVNGCHAANIKFPEKLLDFMTEVFVFLDRLDNCEHCDKSDRCLACMRSFADTKRAFAAVQGKEVENGKD